MTDTTLDRLARAAWTENLNRIPHDFKHPCLPWDQEGEALRDDWRAFVRAVLLELRPLDEASLERASHASLAAGDLVGYDGFSAGWAAVIDAIMGGKV